MLSHQSDGAVLASQEGGPKQRALALGSLAVVGVVAHLWFWGRRRSR